MFRSRVPVPRRRLRPGVAAFVALVLAGSGALTAGASAQANPTMLSVHRSGVLISQGQTCAIPADTVYQPVWDSGTYQLWFPQINCGGALLVQGVQVGVRCGAPGSCSVSAAPFLTTAVAHPGNYAFWYHGFPPYPYPAMVRLDWEGEHVADDVTFTISQRN